MIMRSGEPQPIVLPEKSVKRCRRQAPVFPLQVERPVVRRLASTCSECAGVVGPQDNYCGYCGVRVFSPFARRRIV